MKAHKPSGWCATLDVMCEFVLTQCDVGLPQVQHRLLQSCAPRCPLWYEAGDGMLIIIVLRKAGEEEQLEGDTEEAGGCSTIRAGSQHYLPTRPACTQAATRAGGSPAHVKNSCGTKSVLSLTSTREPPTPRQPQALLPHKRMSRIGVAPRLHSVSPGH
eukprot:366259-Chlamydomonas_euryale.AAC.13